MNEQEKMLLAQWKTVLHYAKQTEKYNPHYTYGVYQIFAELDECYIDEITGEKVWKYKELHAALTSLKNLVKKYYNEEIVPILFKYEFLK